MPQALRTNKAPITDKKTDDQSNGWRSSRPSDEAAPTGEGTWVSVPATVAQGVQRVEQSLDFTLRYFYWSVLWG